MHRELRTSYINCCGRSATPAALAKAPACHCGYVPSYWICRRLQVGHPSRLFVWDLRLVRGAVSSLLLRLNKWLRCQRMDVYRSSRKRSASDGRLEYILGSPGYREWMNRCVYRTSCAVKYLEMRIFEETSRVLSICRIGSRPWKMWRILCQRLHSRLTSCIVLTVRFGHFQDAYKSFSYALPPSIVDADLETPGTQVEHLLA
jgi:hypothetical protein